VSTDSLVFSSYFSRAFASPDSLIEDAKRALKDVRFDTMVGTGLSGALAIPILAPAFGALSLFIRKEYSHGGELAVGSLGKRWLFVDDFIASGATRQSVKKVVNQLVTRPYSTFQTEFVGTYLYQDTRFFI
jgi:adenine/guanine phosphoribosyltransferase-like PRPP-binding protein